ncbi:helix-turn-helix transcriptional regulator [Komarekiella sp. 'clone 1']|uniref:Helix-turn-helix transcriptional regulator n=1 Tax=Komarekiella delphini-convector SJRDD-AB1 TaxID=2593771 RepID=A0AA40T3J7_9NOST|nr:helix-turn-helix transcriptional regulator [Komarekiella delphini-convector]MBD6620023.1 helix-turn-helix transcriptional regulator [Komarekiella delphini-convector SJRDD-AB1]
MTKEVVLVDISYISRFAWNEKMAKRLKEMRGKISREALAAKAGCSRSFIHNLEWGNAANRPESIDKEDALAICNALEVPIWQLYPALALDINNLQKICSNILTDVNTM